MLVLCLLAATGASYQSGCPRAADHGFARAALTSTDPHLCRRRIGLLGLPLLLQSRACAATSPTGVVVNGKQMRVFDVMSSVAGPGGFQGPAGAQLGRLAASRLQLEALIADFEDKSYKGTDEDSIVVLRLSAIYFKESPSISKRKVPVLPVRHGRLRGRPSCHGRLVSFEYF